MSQYLDSLAIGDSIDVKGPLGHVHYLGRVRRGAEQRPRSGRAAGRAGRCRRAPAPARAASWLPPVAVHHRRNPPLSLARRLSLPTLRSHQAQGAYTLDGEAHSARCVSMIAGGTGITPMYQVGWAAGCWEAAAG